MAQHRQAGRARDAPSHRAAPASSLQLSRSAPWRSLGDYGSPLEMPTRLYFEPRLHVDLSAVRIHAGAQAARAARSLRARAFTVDDDIFIGAGQPSLHSQQGRWLLAHELSHVAQRSNSRTSHHQVESEARAAATRLTLGFDAHVSSGRQPGAVHLFGEPEDIPDLTYITTQGSQVFLNEAVAFHTAWGLNPIRIASIEAVVNNLAGRQGTFGRVRIVMHAADLGVFSSLFAGEPLLSLTKERLTAWATSDVAGLAEDLGATFNISQQMIDQLVGNIRSTSPAVLQPFGLGQSGSPTGALRDLFELTAQRFLVAASRTRRNAPAITTVLTTFDTILNAKRSEAAAASGATAQDVTALQPAIVTACTITLQAGGPWSPDPTTVSILERANRAVAGGFRAQLNNARQRFDSNSWIDIRGCRAGDDPDYLRAASAFFGAPGAQPHVSGPNWYQMFPSLAFQTFPNQASLDAVAGNADVTAALDRWAPLTGVRAQLDAWRTYYAYEAARRRQLAARPAAPGGVSPSPTLQLQMPPVLPPLSGGLTTPPAEVVTSNLLLTLPLHLPEPSLLSLRRQPGQGALQGSLTMEDPAATLAENALRRLNEPSAELRYYFGADLVLPVAVAGNPHDVQLFILTPRRQQAVANWLASQWRTRAPGLAALQAGDWRGDQRRVQALVESHDADAEMVFPPDPRYRAHIVSI